MGVIDRCPCLFGKGTEREYVAKIDGIVVFKTMSDNRSIGCTCMYGMV